MCGRYSLHAPHSDIASRYQYQEDWLADAMPRYNVAPGTDIALLAMLECGTGTVSVLMPAHWGFHPQRADAKAPSPINARAEKVATSPYFRNAFQTRRALVPANGWYEWRATDAGDKQPYYITHADGELLMFAGLWEPAGDDRATAAIITQPAVSALQHIHPRMPTVLAPECWASWMDPKFTERDQVRKAVRPLPGDCLIAYPVSKRVNRPVNDDPELIEPVGSVGNNSKA